MKVWIAKLSEKKNLLRCLREVLEHVPLTWREGEVVAVKLHIGEVGNTTFLRPEYARVVYEWLKDKKVLPFLTDTTVIYRGKRNNGIEAHETAIFHGFGFAPFIVADGIRGVDGVKVRVDGIREKEVKIARAVYESDALFVLSHFKGHGVTGFGGAIKNLGMGCSTKEGKLKMHSGTSPWIDKEKCTGCGLCFEACPFNAIKLEAHAEIIPDKCSGCGACISACPVKAIRIKWDASSRALIEKMVDHALGAVRKKRAFYINFLVNITPECDCFPYSKPPVAPDIGLVAGEDPVAVDQASYDLVVEKTGHDPFKKLYPQIDPAYQLACGEKAGLGRRKYEREEL